MTLGLGIGGGVEIKGEPVISSPSLSHCFAVLGVPPEELTGVKELNTKLKS